MGAWADTLRVFAAALLAIELARAAPAVKDDVIYDQRQNGTENYRLHIDGVVIAVAPAEMLLNLADLVDFSNYGGSSGGSDGGGGGGDFVEEDLTPPKPEESSSAVETTTGAAAAESGATEGGAEAAQDAPDKDPSEPAAAADAPTTPKPAKKIKGKLVLSQWLLPLLRRL